MCYLVLSLMYQIVLNFHLIFILNLNVFIVQQKQICSSITFEGDCMADVIFDNEIC